MALKLYLDDCANSDLLADLLTQAGHGVVRPGDVGTLGVADDAHFACAAANGLVLVTKNPHDFQDLHNLDPNHAGIFAVYQDNDPNRDMTDADIVAAVARIEAAIGYPSARGFHNLKSTLGGALLGQKKYAEAEPLLLKGYAGMRAREQTIPPQGKVRLAEALDRLIALYTATNQADEVKKWRAERAKYPAPAGPLPEKKK